MDDGLAESSCSNGEKEDRCANWSLPVLPPRTGHWAYFTRGLVDFGVCDSGVACLKSEKLCRPATGGGRNRTQCGASPRKLHIIILLFEMAECGHI